MDEDEIDSAEEASSADEDDVNETLTEVSKSDDEKDEQKSDKQTKKISFLENEVEEAGTSSDDEKHEDTLTSGTESEMDQRRSLNKGKKSRYSSRNSMAVHVGKHRGFKSFASDDGDDEFMDEELYKHDHTFVKLHEIYQNIVTGLDHSDASGVDNNRVKLLFGKLWNGIQNSHNNVTRLQRKDHDISVDLSALMGKTRNLIKLAEEDPEICAKVRTKLETALGLADIGEVEERKNAIRIYELREDIAMLNRSIKTAVKAEGQGLVVELTKLKSQIDTNRNTHAGELTELNNQMKLLFAKRQELRESRINFEEKMKLLIKEEAVYNEAIDREKQRKEHLLKSIQTTIRKTWQKSSDLEKLLKNLILAEKKLTDIERRVKDRQAMNETYKYDLALSDNRLLKLKQDLETQSKQVDRLNVDLSRRLSDLREKEDEVSTMRILISRLNRQKQANLKKVEAYNHVIQELEVEREALKKKLIILEKELEMAQKTLDENKHHVEVLENERTVMNKTLKHAVLVADVHKTHVITHEVAINSLKTDISGYEKEISHQEKVIEQLEKERDRFSNEAMKIANEIVMRLEESRKLDQTLNEYSKTVEETEKNLKKQQVIYEHAVYERYIVERNLHDEIKAYKSNVTKLYHLACEIQRLRSQAEAMDALVHMESERYERVLRETSFYAAEGKRLQDIAYDNQRMVEALTVEQSLLQRTTVSLEMEMSTELYYANTAESRREVFHRKLMTKEAELREIWEKWNVLRSKVRVGAYHFRIIIQEIRNIRYQILEVKKENIMKSQDGMKKVRKLQHEIGVLENVIHKELGMCNSLRETMRYPINVHRWRVLEFTNPESFEMVQKVTLLTKRLVERNGIFNDQKNDFAFKQKIYCEIREVLKKSPGLETPEVVLYYQMLVGAKKSQYAKLRDELNNYFIRAECYEGEIPKIQDGFKHLKKKYFKKLTSCGRGYMKTYVSDEEDEGHPGGTDSKIASIHDVASKWEIVLPEVNE